MSHYKPYPEYKKSQIDWIGEVPKHWAVLPLWVIAEHNKHSLPENTPKDLSFKYVDISSVQYGKGIVNAEEMSFGSAPSRARRLAEPGDIVVSTVRTYLKAVAPVTEEHQGFVFSTGFAVLHARDNCDPRFLQWLIENEKFIQAVESHSEGLGYPAINASTLMKLKTTLPPKREQLAICNKIDRETARIDALIEKKTRFIELLKEKRQALIMQAVTKGLTPDVEMKDSNVEWLGDIPAHWDIMPLKAIAMKPGSLFIDGDWIESKDIDDKGVRYITTGNVGEGFYKEQGTGYISEATFNKLRCTEVLPGDLLVSRLNLPVGRACIVPDLGGRIVTSVDNVILRPDSNYSRSYLLFLLSTSAHFCNTKNLARGTTMQRISRSALGNIRFAFPPQEEQREIAEYLREKTEKIDTLMTATARSIDLLKERRSALITAAVTGQIDLREDAA